jgi:trehalose 6-phosphate phosphatase
MHWQDDRDRFRQWLAHKRVGLITDVDGTISPITDQPDAAQVTASAKQSLEALAGRLTLVGVISGRAAADVQARVGVPGLIYVGNHGMERWQAGEVVRPPEVIAYRPNLETAIARLQPIADGIDGVILEDKGATLSLHYRLAQDHDAVQREIGPLMEHIERDNDLKVFAGRMIYEIRPPLAMNKGSAFARLVQEFKLDAALYIGDDTTDADALHQANTLREAGDCDALGIGVRSDETPPVVLSTATHTADGIPDVEAFLAWVNTSLG